MSSNYNAPPSFGTSGEDTPFLPISPIGNPVLFEWIALLPLVIYLAGKWLSYHLVGQTALTGFINMGIFPRLGVLNNLADFLTEGSDFLDQASSLSEVRRTVWDANWGSVFPCANGAASTIISKYVLRNSKIIEIPEEDSTPNAPITPPFLPPSQNIRRYQTLHIIECSQSDVASPVSVSHWDRVGSTTRYLAFELLIIVILLGTFTVTVLCGLYGTSTAVLITICFRISRQLIRPTRPGGYLANNEPGASGCMLVALHENASTWYLYIGSRGVIDALLNKPMLSEFTSPFISVRVLGLFLRALGYLQLVAMTYVAAQKGWDGVGLLALVIVAITFDALIYSEARLAALWLKRSNVTMTAKSFRFRGRSIMIGAIQTLKRTPNKAWMDIILAQSDRRDAWIARLNGHPVEDKLGGGDLKWVNQYEAWTLRAIETIEAHMPNFKVSGIVGP